MKKIVCKYCKDEFLTSKFSSKKYCNKCKQYNTKILECIFCKNKKSFPSNTSSKNSICKECKDKGLKLKRKTKIIICSICKQNNVELYYRTSNKFSICNSCKSKGFKTELSIKMGKLLLENIKDIDHISKNKKIKIKLQNKNKEEWSIIRKKANKTYKEKTGFDSPMKNPDIIKKVINISEKTKREKESKRKNTCIERYGVQCSLLNNKVKEKSIKTNLKNYGDVHWTKNEEKKKILINNGLKNNPSDRLNILKKINICLIDNEYINAKHRHTWKCLICNYQFITCWNNIQQGYLCPHCYIRDSGSSIAEQEIYKFIRNLINKNIIILQRDISTVGIELDIYIPELKIAIEYNGIFYHSSDIDNIDIKNYHLNKTNLCEEKGIQLIHIFEDEWIYKKDIVKSRLKNILNIKSDYIIYARKCIIKEIDPTTKNDFLEENHIQGKDNSNIKLGAYYNNNLISVMTFSKGNISKGSKSKEGIWELNRFCSKLNYQAIGIASKLLSYFKKNYIWIEIFSYADRRWSNGNVYYKLGFKLDNITYQNYWYIKNCKRIHRFALRKRNDEPKNISEKILRLEEGYRILYDCGNYKFSISNTIQQKNKNLIMTI